MLNKDSRALLKSMLPINNSMIIEDTTYGRDEFSSILFKLNLKEVEQESITPFGIFDMGSFLSALDLLDDPNINLESNIITAKDSNSTLKFVTSDISSLEDIQVKPSIIDSTLAVDSILEFNFGAAALAKIKKASSTFKVFDTLFIVKDKNGTNLKMGTKDSFSKSNNSFSMNIDPDVDSDKEFEIALPLESVLKIPAMDFTFMVKYNEKRDAYRVVLNNTLMTFVMSLIK
jgi:hypothetical protein